MRSSNLQDVSMATDGLLIPLLMCIKTNITVAGAVMVDGKLPVSRTGQRHTFLVSEAVLY